MKLSLRTLIVWALLACALVGAPLHAAFAQALPPQRLEQVNPHAIPVTGTLPDSGTFAGTLNLTRFEVQDGQLVALGRLSGTLKDSFGQAIGTVEDVQTTQPVGNITGSCEVMNLMLGSLTLDLAGQKVRLDRVLLDIVAQPGPANLLGNLSCAVLNLVDTNGSLRSIADLLNVVLRTL